MPHDVSIFGVLVNPLGWIFHNQPGIKTQPVSFLFLFLFLDSPTHVYKTTLVVFKPFLPLNPLLQPRILKTWPNSCSPTTDRLNLLFYLNGAAWERETPLRIAIAIISHSTTHTPVQMNFILMMRKPKLMSYCKLQHLYANLWDSLCSLAFSDTFSFFGPGQPST